MDKVRIEISPHELCEFSPHIPLDVCMVLLLGRKGAPLLEKSYFDPKLDMINYNWSRFDDIFNDKIIFEYKKIDI